jgi:hypothetical protein
MAYIHSAAGKLNKAHAGRIFRYGANKCRRRKTPDEIPRASNHLNTRSVGVRQRM